jgi:AcrR family transcriptional regulator
MPAETRDRIVDATAALFMRQGYNGTGVKQIVAEAGAPFASLYHFFPGGKEELGDEVIRTSGAMYGQLVDAFYMPGVDPIVATRRFFAAAAEHLVETGYADACPIATVALEVASTNDLLRRATADVFEGWLQKATVAFVGAGIRKKKARELAIAFVALLEGGFLLCRAARSTEALQAAGTAAVALVKAALPA